MGSSVILPVDSDISSNINQNTFFQWLAVYLCQDLSYKTWLRELLDSLLESWSSPWASSLALSSGSYTILSPGGICLIYVPLEISAKFRPQQSSAVSINKPTQCKALDCILHWSFDLGLKLQFADCNGSAATARKIAWNRDPAQKIQVSCPDCRMSDKFTYWVKRWVCA